MKRKGILAAVIVILMLVTAACSNSGTDSNKPDDSVKTGNTVKETNKEEEAQPNATPAEPVTITIAFPWGEEIFNSRFKPIEEKLENVTIKRVDAAGTNEALQELFATGAEPDIIIGNHGFKPLFDLDVVEPLDELMKINQFDESILDPSLVAYLRAQDPEGRLMGFPDGQGGQVLFYNKEIFDLFGVPYPDPDKSMTWDELLSLAAKMTAERDGKKYVGLEFGWGSMDSDATVALNELALNKTDPDTGEVLITKDPGFTKYFDWMKKFYSIPGIVGEHTKGKSLFSMKQAAMSVNWNGILTGDWGDKEFKKNMDIAPVPVWADAPEKGPIVGTSPMVVTTFSKHKNEAFKVLAEYMSDENQTNILKDMASGPAVSNPDIRKTYGTNVEAYADKNISAFFKVWPAMPEKHFSGWDQYVDIGASLAAFAESDKDVATFLRKLKEESETKIKEAMAAAK
ncbi:ABC transporter substrate-binding protein [Paenibacillus nasutitermitis]|uniref:Sugar ABC transporter substrate-binding protein n=1 Tax=Paenibacillus nasutitermitis TaxID=1652958 RepID=A0A917DSA5_9BACL|nr:extracellular solute-binding protein [Paenibacillus nasutitermitis]GGD66271.1 sugar ABC transporter substrate-binding protein [Paenibacillus nasutitermitis]